MILPRYTPKDGLIMITMLTPVTIVMNLFLFGHRYFFGVAGFHRRNNRNVSHSCHIVAISYECCCNSPQSISWRFPDVHPGSISHRGLHPDDKSLYHNFVLRLWLYRISWIQVQRNVLHLGDNIWNHWEHLHNISSWRGQQLRKVENHDTRNGNFKERIYSIATNGIENTGESPLFVQ